MLNINVENKKNVENKLAMAHTLYLPLVSLCMLCQPEKVGDKDIYIYIYIYIYANLPVNAIVRLPHPRRGDSQDQETFLAPSADKQTRNYDTEGSNHHPSLSTLRPKGLNSGMNQVNYYFFTSSYDNVFITQ